jgi:F-type H+-transporting ATPase subunit a
VKYHRFKIFGFEIPNRYIVLALIILGILGARAFSPIRPHVQVAPEPYPGGPLFTLPIIGEFHWTNTMMAMVIADIIIILIALTVNRVMKGGEMVPKGLTGVIEAFMEIIYNLTESTAGKWAKVIFPFFATITLFVLVINWMELVPGVDSIGFVHHAEHGYPTQELMPGVVTIVKNETDAEHGEDAEHSEGEEATAAEEHADGYHIIPFVRVLSTDLNFTVGLALVAVIMVQVVGVRALGPGYFSKFINLKALWNFFKQPMGIIDFGVGILEIVSEFSKILSFSFRLFGNIFAGSVMLFVIGSLVPVLAQVIFLGLELFVGLIQAFVFGMLTMVFMTQATVSHGDHGDEHAH